MSITKKIKGLTLIEMGIALLIISAILVSVTGGVVVRHKMRLKTIMDGFSQISQAVYTFQGQYDNAIPGDIWNANKYMGDTVNNGNGNKIIDNNEHLLFWQHLSLSGLLDNSYDGTTNEPAIGVMRGDILSSGYYVRTDNDNNIIIGFSVYRDSDASGSIDRNDSEDRLAVISAEDAWHIDNNYDDGFPNSGFIRGVEGNSITAGECIDNNSTVSDTSDDIYNASNDDEVCIIEIIINSNI